MSRLMIKGYPHATILYSKKLLPWHWFAVAFADYNRKYPGFTINRFAERGGFCEIELDEHLPGWEKHAIMRQADE